MAGFQARKDESATVHALLDAAAAGSGGALVVHGEAGIGKTALLRHVLDGRSGHQELHAAGARFEHDLPFAGLHQLCAPVLHRVSRLAAAQRAALEGAIGQHRTADPNLFLIGVAVLHLLTDLGAERPVVCVIDDAQRLDEASTQVFSFVARRLTGARVTLLFALRDPEPPRHPRPAPALTGLPRLALRALPDRHARALLRAELPTPLDPPVRERILAEARGNPAVLLEFLRGTTPAALAGGFGTPSGRSASWPALDDTAARLEALPPVVRTFLVLAAAEPLGDPLMLWRAAAQLGIDREAATTAEAADVLRIGTRVCFRHPLVRSLVYRAAPSVDRRLVHRALAAVTDGALDPDRRAWHRAQAVHGLDEDVAAELERLADRARNRGGLWAAAAFLERAAALTPEPRPRAHRALAAAQLIQQAGDPPRAAALLRWAEDAPLSSQQRELARVLRERAALGRVPHKQAASALLRAARDAQEPANAAELCLEALTAAMLSGPSNADGSLSDLARSVRATAPAHLGRPLDLLLDGLTARLIDGYEQAVPALRRAVDTYRHQTVTSADQRWMWLACLFAADLWDGSSWRTLADRQITWGQHTRALRVLPFAFSYRGIAHLHAGDFGATEACVREAATLDSFDASIAGLLLAAWRGDERELAAIRDARLHHTPAHGESRFEVVAQHASAVLHNSLGRYETALAEARKCLSHDVPGMHAFIGAEFIEAAVRAGRADLARPVLDQLAADALAAGTDWAHAVLCRSQAQLADGPAADDLYRRAIALFDACGHAAEAGRARLIYGEWLLRERRRDDAYVQMQSARDQLVDIGALGFAQRATLGLTAAGTSAHPRAVVAGPSAEAARLTDQELLIARHVARGLTNKEIAAELYLSPRTIDAHLRRIFRKLDISSRRQLRDLQFT
ncbi:AAA family ATPase [Catenuloplanes atrovinosus]|uniref:DNA-binding CsgD family transcriptional regulator n=1 Tax=Catenuloplanes atrovinosus TaxID=137266 RepID=A0AAE3YRI7_9ACTN|nr:AAA family ATPase [Catenuloplanes atrovinosus]MDR7277322.1 DNA-binding CsgD family transcriptional regulator [Catenuloplanes atrovinosus]